LEPGNLFDQPSDVDDQDSDGYLAFVADVRCRERGSGEDLVNVDLESWVWAGFLA
jgi:hypothetical protein